MSTDPLPHARERVTLRRLAPGDLPDFQAYRHDPEVARYQGWSAQPDADVLAFLEAESRAAAFAPGSWFQLAIADRASGRLLGDIGVRVDDATDQAEIGFTLSRAAQGRGLAHEAVSAALALVFAHTPVARIVGITDERNLASIRLLERLGMKCVTTRSVEFRGEPCLERVYAIERAGRARTNRPA